MKKIILSLATILVAFSIVNAQSREELLQLAVLKSDVAKAKEILSQGPLKEGKIVGPSKSLMIAVTNNDVPMALALIDAGVNAAWKDYTGVPIISKAINPEVAKGLIAHGANMYYDNPLSAFTSYCLVSAAEQKKILDATRKALLAQKQPADAIERGMKVKKALFITLKDINDMVKVYNDAGFSYVKSRDMKGGADIIFDAVRNENYEFLHAAFTTGQLDKAYLNNPIPISKKSRYERDKRKTYPNSYLVDLIYYRNDYIVNAGIQKRTNADFTAIIEKFLKEGSLLNSLSKEYSPLQEAARLGDEYACSELIRLGADVHFECLKGGEAVVLAKEYPTIKVLYDHGADLFTKNHADETCLFRIDDVKAITFLVGKGLDVNARSTTGRTPIFSVLTTDAINALVKYKADINAIDNYQRNILMYYTWAIHDSWGFGIDREAFYINLAKCIIANGISKECIQNAIELIKDWNFAKNENQENYLKLLESHIK